MDVLSVSTHEELSFLTRQGVDAGAKVLLSEPRSIPYDSFSFMLANSSADLASIYDSLITSYKSAGWTVKRVKNCPEIEKRRRPLLIMREETASLAPGKRSRRIIGIEVHVYLFHAQVSVSMWRVTR
jgi:hypothetical protein